MSGPPLPPRPYNDDLPKFGSASGSRPPPVPPLPPQLANDLAREQASELAHPKPYRLNGGPGDIAQRLDNQLGFPQITGPYGPPPPLPQAGGYSAQPPPRWNPSPAPPPPPAGLYGQTPPQAYTPQPYNQPQTSWNTQQQSSWPPQGPPPRQTPALPPWGVPLPNSPATGYPPPNFPEAGSRLTQSFAELTFSPPLPASQQPQPQPAPRRSPTPPRNNGEAPAVVIPLPTIASLMATSAKVSATTEITHKVMWSKDVLDLVERTQVKTRSSKSGSDEAKLTDPELIRLADTAINHLLTISAFTCSGPSIPLYVAEALYLRATLSASGTFPSYLPKDPRSAFRDFEAAARGGYHPAWFKLGRDYESVGDPVRAKDCFERGVALNETSCLYRLAMASLLGQLNLPKNPQIGLSVLKQAADKADVDAPQPAYVYGMVLLGEFDQADVPMPLIMSTLPPASSQNPDPRQSEARRRIERAAYLNFAPAQYKLGWAYEYAKLGLGFDPLLSVQYYSLASQQGETEADMALSKWFLCGSEGAFEKDENLAVTFAEKAARKGLAAAEFAMGYYCEVGIGGPKDLPAARKWYQRAAAHHNQDAVQRLAALSQPAPEALSRAEHDRLTDTTLVRKRTAAKEYSMASGRGSGERRGSGDEMKEAMKVAQTAKEERKNVPMAQDGLPLPVYPTGSPSVSPVPSPGASGRPLPSTSPASGRRQQALPPGQQPLPGSGAGTAAGRFGANRRDQTLPAGQASPPRKAGSGDDRRGQGQGSRHNSYSTSSGGIDLSQPLSGGRQQKPGQGQRQSYALTDDGPASGGGRRPPKPSVTPVPVNISTSPVPAPVPVSATVPAPRPAAEPAPPSGKQSGGKKYETFAEMGFQSAPVKENDCVIM